MACKDVRIGEDFKTRIEGKIYVLGLNLSELDSIHAFAHDFKKSCGMLHILIHLEGTYCHERVETREGIELSFATNVLGTLLLTTLLLDLLEKSAPSRVVLVCSPTMLKEKLEIEDVEFRQAEHFDPWKVYTQNQRRLVTLTELMARKHRASGVAYYSCHTGVSCFYLHSPLPNAQTMVSCSCSCCGGEACEPFDVAAHLQKVS